MKKRLLILSLFVLIFLSPVFSRPQFFFGGGVEWGKLYMNESEISKLEGNTRYSNPKDGAYISHFVPTLEATFIPVADIGVGITCSFGYGGVLGYNNGSKLYSSSDNGYSIFTDSIVDASIGVRYMTVMAKEKYLSFTSDAQYNYRGYFLSRGPINNGYISKDNGVVDNIISLTEPPAAHKLRNLNAPRADPAKQQPPVPPQRPAKDERKQHSRGQKHNAIKHHLP